MRGARRRRGGPPGLRGIIPADAGSTQKWCVEGLHPQDHPRGCGEHSLRLLECQSTAGSSPRMRGALSETRFDPFGGGIIPADAGSTTPLQLKTMSEKDHPRGCGEHLVVLLFPVMGLGSSPRMRRALLNLPGRVLGLGIIPADAGSTRSIDARRSPGPDHPRGCGEHLYQILKWVGLAGSSPRMRGAPRDRISQSATSRIIPADAGSTSVASYHSRLVRDHPRGCGEHAAV